MNGPAPMLATNPLPVPPKLAATRGASPVGLVIGALAVVGLGAVLFWFNPAEHGFYPQCFFHHVTSLQCPGCGGLRAIHQLLHGHLLAALHLNSAAVLSLPLFAGLLWREIAGRRKGLRGRHFVSGRWVGGLVGMLLVFTLLRNLPAFAFLSP